MFVTMARSKNTALQLRATLAGMSAATLLALTGCGSTQHAQLAPPNTAPQTQPSAMSGESWSAVFAPPQLENQLTAQGDLGVNTRRDEKLQPREHRLATALDQWPRPARPSLGRDRFFRVSNPNSNGFIFYESSIETSSYSRSSSYERRDSSFRSGARGWP